MRFHWPDKKTTQIFEALEELHRRLKYSLDQMKIEYNRKKKLKTVSEEFNAYYEKLMSKMFGRRGKKVEGKAENFNDSHIRICTLFQCKQGDDGGNNIEKLCLKEKYS